MSGPRQHSSGLLRGLPILLTLTLVFGCAQTFDATTLGVPVTMAAAAGQPVQGARFEVTSKLTSAAMVWRVSAAALNSRS